jgi:hypothetical protein
MTLRSNASPLGDNWLPAEEENIIMRQKILIFNLLLFCTLNGFCEKALANPITKYEYDVTGPWGAKAHVVQTNAPAIPDAKHS